MMILPSYSGSCFCLEKSPVTDRVTTRACERSERERSGERSGHISFRAESAFLKISLAQYAQHRSLKPKMPFGMGGAREVLAGAQHPQENQSTPIKFFIK